MEIIEWFACFAGLLGAALLACNNTYSRWGFVSFMASNILWIAYGLQNEAYGLVVMQVGFTITSTWGIVNWFPSIKQKLA